MKNEKSRIIASFIHFQKMGDLEDLRRLIPEINSICNPLDFQVGFNIFLIQNKGKGPPGRARCPERVKGIFPEHPSVFIPLGFQKPDNSCHKIDELLILNGWKRSTKLAIVRWNDQLFEN